MFPCSAPAPAMAQLHPVVGGFIRLEPAVSGWNWLCPAGTGCIQPEWAGAALDSPHGTPTAPAAARARAPKPSATLYTYRFFL